MPTESQLVAHNRATLPQTSPGEPVYLSDRPWEGIADPALRGIAGSSQEISPDCQRWLAYADRELTRLRALAGLADAEVSYRLGVACYDGQPLAGQPLAD